MRYTRDGSEPDEFSTVCSENEILTAATGEVIKVRAFYSGWTPSNTVFSDYDLGDIGPAGGWIYQIDDTGSEEWRFKEIIEAGAGLTWEEATALCDELEEAGYDDWYLPSYDEAGTIYTDIEDLYGVHLNGMAWTSTERDGDTAQAHYIVWATGARPYDPKTETYMVYAVHTF